MALLGTTQHIASKLTRFCVFARSALAQLCCQRQVFCHKSSPDVTRHVEADTLQVLEADFAISPGSPSNHNVYEGGYRNVQLAMAIAFHVALSSLMEHNPVQTLSVFAVSDLISLLSALRCVPVLQELPSPQIP